MICLNAPTETPHVKVEDDVENLENKVNFAGSDDKSIINECYLQDEEVPKVYAVNVPYQVPHVEVAQPLTKEPCGGKVD